MPTKQIYRVLYDKETTPDGNFYKCAEIGVERENEFAEVKTPNKIVEEFSLGVWTVTVINTDGSEETIFNISRIFRKIRNGLQIKLIRIGKNGFRIV